MHEYIIDFASDGAYMLLRRWAEETTKIVLGIDRLKHDYGAGSHYIC